MIFEKLNPDNCLKFSELIIDKYRKIIRQKVPNKPGIYIIRCLENGVPRQFNRLNGIDKEGIMCIGKSKNLSKRVIQFVSDILTEGLKVRHHSEGWNFRQYFRDNPKGGININVDDLEFFWKETSSEGEALELERHLIQKYVMFFQDKPPLNISIKRKR